MGCLRDRLSHNVPIETYQGREEWYQCQKELLLRIKKGFSVMKKDYSVNIPQSAIACIDDILFRKTDKTDGFNEF